MSRRDSRGVGKAPVLRLSVPFVMGTESDSNESNTLVRRDGSAIDSATILMF